MKVPFEVRIEVIKAFLRKQLTKSEVALKLNCSLRSIERYREAFIQFGAEGLKDHRHGNNRKLTSKDEDRICELKRLGPWRSARKIKDLLRLPIHPKTVREVWVKYGLNRLNYPRLKPIQRFEAVYPNDLWQTDIMGKMALPNLGVAYLIATLDDHSRFCLSGRWFKTQRQINVFQVWYNALTGWGTPKEILQDRGSQYHPRTKLGQSDYQFHAGVLGINLRWANRAQTKGKIERFWNFVQRDFVRENLDVASIEELNRRFNRWISFYNFEHQSSALEGKTRAERYQPSKHKANRVDLKTLLSIEERRKVMSDSTISLYGERYKIPAGYIGCRIWVKIVGDKLIFEAMGRVIFQDRLKLS